MVRVCVCGGWHTERTRSWGGARGRESRSFYFLSMRRDEGDGDGDEESLYIGRNSSMLGKGDGERGKGLGKEEMGSCGGSDYSCSVLGKNERRMLERMRVQVRECRLSIGFIYNTCYVMCRVGINFMASPPGLHPQKK